MIVALNIGETAICRDQGEIICFGLASCVGVFLYDRIKRIGAAAHIFLPDRGRCQESGEMISSIIREMIYFECNPYTIQARLVGGANVLPVDCFEIGRRNLELVRRSLFAEKIRIQGEDTGGKVSRTARLDIQSGRLSVRNPYQNFYTI